LAAWAADEAKGLATPMLVLIGEDDGALSENYTRQAFMAWYPNATLEVMTNSGHYPMAETPITLATLIENFITSHR
jgi:pimeloyl-ACP methyl ester carboxylesterase